MLFFPAAMVKFSLYVSQVFITIDNFKQVNEACNESIGFAMALITVSYGVREFKDYGVKRNAKNSDNFPNYD